MREPIFQSSNPRSLAVLQASNVTDASTRSFPLSFMRNLLVALASTSSAGESCLLVPKKSCVELPWPPRMTWCSDFSGNRSSTAEACGMSDTVRITTS